MKIRVVMVKVKSKSGGETDLMATEFGEASLFEDDKIVAKKELKESVERFLEEASSHLASMQKTAVFPCLPPSPGGVAFGVNAADGAYEASASREELVAGRHPLSFLHRRAQELIDDLRSAP